MARNQRKKPSFLAPNKQSPLKRLKKRRRKNSRKKSETGEILTIWPRESMQSKLVTKKRRKRETKARSHTITMTKRDTT